MLEEPCPDASALRRLLLGELSGTEATALEKHFARCERCLRLAEELSEDRLDQALRTRAALPPDPRPRGRRRVDRAAAAPAPAGRQPPRTGRQARSRPASHDG